MSLTLLMRSNEGSRRSAQHRTAGFTLIELLVVIAIIAILTAIIFPVYATLQENARQKTSMANLESIQKGLAQFKLDNGRYPDVLFGYAYPVSPGTNPPTFVRMDKALAQAEADGQAANPPVDVASSYFPGLYPEYVSDVTAFTDGNNQVRDYSKTTESTDSVATIGPLAVNALVKDTTDTSGQTYKLQQTTTVPINPPAGTNAVTTDFYLADAYDLSPQIDGTTTNRFVPSNNKPTYVVRYQKSWTPISAAASQQFNVPAANPPQFNYNRQLRWTNPPADTFITCTTDHVPNSNKVLVVWESGTAKAIDASQFLATGAGGADSASVANATFWEVSPTH